LFVFVLRLKLFYNIFDIYKILFVTAKNKRAEAPLFYFALLEF